MKEEFIQFLKDNNCLEQFEASLISDANENDEKTMDDLLRVRRLTPIMSAFVWSSTPEGYEYWYELNEKWESL